LESDNVAGIVPVMRMAVVSLFRKLQGHLLVLDGFSGKPNLQIDSKK
jgi:hypothetical protein